MYILYIFVYLLFVHRPRWRSKYRRAAADCSGSIQSQPQFVEKACTESQLVCFTSSILVIVVSVIKSVYRFPVLRFQLPRDYYFY